MEDSSNEMYNLKYKNNSNEIIYHQLLNEKYSEKKKSSIENFMKGLNSKQFEEAEERNFYNKVVVQDQIPQNPLPAES